MMKVKGLSATKSDLEESTFDEEQSEGSELENFSIASATNVMEKTIKAAQEKDPKVDYGQEFILKPEKVKPIKRSKDPTSSSNVANAPE